MLSRCTLETSLGWLVGVREVVAVTSSLGLRLGLRLPALLSCVTDSWLGWTVTTRPWVLLKCSIRSQVISLFGQYGHITCGEVEPTPLAPAPGVAASVVVV